MIQQSVAKWKAGEITWEDLVEIVGKMPVTPRDRPTPPPDETLAELWTRVEETPHRPGTWDDLYLEWLFKQLTDDEFHKLEAALLNPRPPGIVPNDEV